MNFGFNYSLHFYEHAGRYQETLSVPGSTLADAIEVAEARHPGFKALLMEGGGTAVSTANGIFLKRSGKPTVPVADLKTPLADGDALAFW